MEELYVFGTGNAAVTRCYNTCFALHTEDQFFMVDAGGGNGILKILEDMDVDMAKIHHIFVTHGHTDHVLGIIWMVRFITSRIKNGSYEGDLHIYCHSELADTIDTFCRLTLQAKLYQLIGERVHIIPVSDGQTVPIMNYDVTFFDIHSTKARQFGFTTILQNKGRLTCAGDEPYHPSCRQYVENSAWLLHEAFCLYSQKDLFKPYEKHHSTVKDACELAEDLHISNLVLWHTEDKTLADRKAHYMSEGGAYFHGRLFVPDDGEIIPL